MIDARAHTHTHTHTHAHTYTLKHIQNECLSLFFCVLFRFSDNLKNKWAVKCLNASYFYVLFINELNVFTRFTLFWEIANMMCEMMTSPDTFFILSKLWFYGLLGDKREKNYQKWQKLLVSLRISGALPHMIEVFGRNL